MKPLKILVLCFSLISIIGCNKNDSVDLNNIEVEEYVELLKKGEYEPFADLPNFSSADIPSLLEFRNKTQIITDFPHNPISSTWGSECSLGMYVLWTIESIRAVAINSKYLIGRFPSQNPFVQKREDWSHIEHSVEIQKIISNAYFDWWEENRDKEFDDFKNMDPLLRTEYRWH